jgi:hypothetical protein
MSKTLDFMRHGGVALPPVENASEITSLRIWNCRFKSLNQLSALENLEELVVCAFPHDSLEILSNLPQLRYLQIVGMPKVTSLQHLSTLVRLECLSLATLPAWDAAKRRTIVNSLAPLTGLGALKHLELFGVCPPDLSLAALHTCRGIETARFSQYPANEVAAFYLRTGAVNRFNPPSTFSDLGAGAAVKS